MTDFPQPDSPTMPTVSPARMSKLTPSTAFATAPPRWKYVRRSCTRSSGSPAADVSSVGRAGVVMGREAVVCSTRRASGRRAR